MDVELRTEVLELVKKFNQDEEINHLSMEYNYSKANHHFHSSLSMHNGTREYTRAINNMYYLDDDLNDDQKHFYAAQERFHINNDLIRNRLKDIKDKLEPAEMIFSSEFFSEDFVL